MGQYIGMVQLGSALSSSILVTNGSQLPVNADSAPSYRVYGPSGVMNNGTGTLSFKHTGSVTGATNDSPIVITSAGHNLTTGTRVTVTGVGGNTAANATAAVTVVNSNSFSLDGTTGNGAYTSGGTWNASGLYAFALTPTGGNGYEAGQNYAVVINAVISSAIRGDIHSFTVT